MEHPDETLPLWPYEHSSDHPLSAVHDPWVPVSEDCTVVSFRLVTPTDLVLRKGFFDDRARHHNREPFILPNDERSPNVEDVCIPPTSPTPPYRMQKPHPPSPVQSESEAPHLTPPASPRLLDAALHHHPRHRMDGQTSLPCLRTPGNPDGTQLISTLDIEDSLIVLKSTGVSQDGTDSDDEIDGQSQHVAMPTHFLAAGPNQDISDIKLLGHIIWSPDNLAKQLCVLMHTLYATIRQDNCLDWTRGCRSTEVTGLRHFFDIHDDIASWVRNSILSDNDMTRQTETLNFWIRVAERCHLHRNFDSLCAIILALSVSRSSSSFGSAWRRCAHKRTFATLLNMLDVKNKFSCFMGIMDAAKGPSVPFVRRYLEHIKEVHPERFNNPPHQSRHADDAGLATPCKIQLAGISTLLRHQSSRYDFKIAKVDT
ncbi:ras guanine nucleotide exchange factor domain-containing protein [Boletus edulis]|nr:ras guanine nucleotide exchange factor domain-containing protein [Boletus edulis]